MVADIMILALLRLGPKHGYDIKKRIERILQQKGRMNTNLLYPALHRLEEMQAIERDVHEQDGRPTKFVYRITPIGERHLRELIEQFGEAEAAKEDEFLVRLACFDLVDERSRLRILDQRRLALTQRLTRGKTIRAVWAEDIDSPWIERIVSFGERRLREELGWLEEIEKLAIDAPAEETARTNPGGLKL